MRFPLSGRARDLHPLDYAHVGRTKREFDRPPKWRDAPILSSPLIVDFDSTWSKIAAVYQSELSVLSYRTIPGPNEIADSMKGLIKVVIDAIR